MHRTAYVVAAAALALAAAACSSSSSPSTTAKSGSGTETFYGTTTSVANSPTIPLKASGVFSDTGSITLTGSGNKSGKGTLHFSKGSIEVEHSKGVQSGGAASGTCHVTFGEAGTFTALSGTGSYKDIAGHGTYKLSFSGTVKRKHDGRCDVNANPETGTALTTFKATGPFTVKR